MSDDSNSAWNGLTKVWPSLKHKLLCHWHVMKNVRERCGNRGNKNKSKVQVTEDSDKCIDITPESYGTPTWELFYIMMKEPDEGQFRQQLSLFRRGLKSHGQHKLLEYFEKSYFTEHRIRQWACWYRHKMYNCVWILDTNMHVESWHNFLKTDILHRKSNVRIDMLILALMKSEKVCINHCRIIC